MPAALMVSSVAVLHVLLVVSFLHMACVVSGLHTPHVVLISHTRLEVSILQTLLVVSILLVSHASWLLLLSSGRWQATSSMLSQTVTPARGFIALWMPSILLSNLGMDSQDGNENSVSNFRLLSTAASFV